VLAGLALERVVEESHRSWVTREIFKRARMTTAGFFARVLLWRGCAGLRSAWWIAFTRASHAVLGVAAGVSAGGWICATFGDDLDRSHSGAAGTCRWVLATCSRSTPCHTRPAGFHREFLDALVGE